MAASKQNRVFFSLLKQALIDQPNPDWVFKSSILKARGFEQILTTTPILEDDKVDDIFQYIEEVKPYRSKFETKIELKKSSEDSAEVQVQEFPYMNITLMYDRVSVQPDQDLGSTLTEIQFRNAANRIATWYSSTTEQLDYRELLDSNFKGIQIQGGSLYHDRVGFDDYNLLDAFIGDGVTTEFETYISNTTDIVVRLNSVDVYPTVEQEKIVFETAPAPGDIIELMYGVTQAYFEKYGYDTPTKYIDHAAINQTTFSKPSSDFDVRNVTVYLDDDIISRTEYEVTEASVILNNPVTGTVKISHIDHDQIYDRVLTSSAWKLFCRSRIKGTTLTPTVNVNGTNGIVVNGDLVLFTGAGDLTSVILDINSGTSPDFRAYAEDGFLVIGSTTEQEITLSSVGPQDNLSSLGLISQPTEYTDSAYNGDGFIRPQYAADRPEELTALRINEGTDIRVYTNSISITAEPGFDDNGYDNSGFDSGTLLVNGVEVTGFDEAAFDSMGFDFTSDQDAFLGNGPGIFTISGNNPAIGSLYELTRLPYSTDSILVFIDSELGVLDTDYEVDYTDPGYGDSQRDDRITYPRIRTLKNGTRIDIVWFSYGGASIERQLRKFGTSSSVIDTGIDLSADSVHVLVDGTVATFTVTGTEVTITSPVVSNSSVTVTVFGSPEYTGIRSTAVPTGSGTIIPSGPTPSYKNAFVLHTGSVPNRVMISPFIKMQRANGTDTFTSSRSSLNSGTTEVYLDGVRLTNVSPAVPVSGEFRVSGADVQLGDIPSEGSEVLIVDTQGAEYTLSSVTDPFDTITVSSDATVLTFDSLRYSGLTTESFEGITDSELAGYELGRSPFTGTAFVFVNGLMTRQGIDWYIDQTDRRTVRFMGSPDHTGDRIQILYDSFRSLLPTVGFRISNDNKGNPVIYRIADQHTGDLASDFGLTDTEFFVYEGTHLGQPSPAGVYPRYPGVVYIGSERIEFTDIDYSVSPHRVYGLTRGTWNTGIVPHLAGSKVIDGSIKQLSPTNLVVDNDARVRHYVSSNQTTFKIPGPVRSPSDIRVFTRDQITLTSALLRTSSSVGISSIQGIRLPSPTVLVSNATPAGFIEPNDAFLIEVVTPSTSVLVRIELTGTADASECSSLINSSSELSVLGITSSVESDRLTILSEYGCDFKLTNNVGYPLQVLFGGSALGSNLSPSVTVGSSNGISINGSSVIFTGAGDIDSVARDINVAAIPNIRARNRAGYLEIIHLSGGTIVLSDIDPGEDCLAVLGLTTDYPETNNWGSEQISGEKDDAFYEYGRIWVQNDVLEFSKVDMSGLNPVLFGLQNASVLESEYELGTKILVSNLRERSDFAVQGQNVVMNSPVPAGSVVRIQNRDVTGRLVIPSGIQSSSDALGRFLQAAPGSIQE